MAHDQTEGTKETGHRYHIISLPGQHSHYRGTILEWLEDRKYVQTRKSV